MSRIEKTWGGLVIVVRMTEGNIPVYSAQAPGVEATGPGPPCTDASMSDSDMCLQSFYWASHGPSETPYALDYRNSRRDESERSNNSPAIGREVAEEEGRRNLGVQIGGV